MVYVTGVPLVINPIGFFAMLIVRALALQPGGLPTCAVALLAARANIVASAVAHAKPGNRVVMSLILHMIILLQLFLSFFVSIVDLLVSRLRPMAYLAPHSERPTTPAQPVFVDQVNQAIHLMTISAGAIRS